jgi:hypothetical protein
MIKNIHQPLLPDSVTIRMRLQLIQSGVGIGVWNKVWFGRTILNPYVGVNDRVQYGTTKSEAALGVYFCPSDRGGYGGAWGNAGGKDRLQPALLAWLQL